MVSSGDRIRNQRNVDLSFKSENIDAACTLNQIILT